MSGLRKLVSSFSTILAIGIITLLAAFRTVSFKDTAFVIFSLIYINILSKYSFPSDTSSPNPNPPIFSMQNKILRIYVTVGAIVGLYLPVAYITAGKLLIGVDSDDDEERIQLAATHIFLLASQVFMEGVTFSCGFSIPVRVFVPVFYNSTRIFAILDWMRAEFVEYRDFDNEDGIGRVIYRAGKGLAVANLVFWCFNLFGFLLPVYLPRAFRRYFTGVHKD